MVEHSPQNPRKGGRKAQRVLVTKGAGRLYKSESSLLLLSLMMKMMMKFRSNWTKVTSQALVSSSPLSELARCLLRSTTQNRTFSF